MDTSTLPSNPPVQSNVPKTTQKRDILIVSFVLLVLVAFGFLYFFNSQKGIRTITTIGTGKINVQAQKREITIVLVNRGSSKDELVRKSRAEFEEVLASIQTHQVESISQSAPQIIPTGAETRGDGQTVFNNFEYRQAAQINVVGQVDAERVSNLLNEKNVFIAQTTYLPPEETSVEEQLLNSALDDSTAKANSLAHAAKLKVGKVLSVSEIGVSQNNSGLVTVNESNQIGTNSSISEAPSSNNITLQKTISVTFELK